MHDSALLRRVICHFDDTKLPMKLLDDDRDEAKFLVDASLLYYSMDREHVAPLRGEK